MKLTNRIIIMAKKYTEQSKQSANYKVQVNFVSGKQPLIKHIQISYKRLLVSVNFVHFCQS